MYCHTKLVLVATLAMAISAAPQLPPGIDAAICPNYPFCGPSPQGAPALAAQPQVYLTHILWESLLNLFEKQKWQILTKVPGLAAHAAAERAVIAQQSFTGLVGPSGNIGPSGLCGPSGCVQF